MTEHFQTTDSRSDTRNEPAPLELGWTTPLIIRSVMLTGIFVLLLFYTLYLAAPVLIPITLAFLLSMALAPLVRWLAAIHIPQGLGAGLVLLALLGLVGAGIYWLSGPAIAWMDRAPQVMQQVGTKLQHLKKPIEDVQKATQQVEKMAQLSEAPAAPGELVVTVKEPGPLRLLMQSTPAVLAGIGLVIILMYFLLASGDSFLRKLVAVIPRLQDKKRAVEIVRSIQENISTYLLTMILINIGLGIAVTIAMYFLEVPNPILWGVVAAALNFAPYIGVLINMAILGVVGLLTFDSLAHALAVPAVIFLLNTVEGEFITPMVMGQRLELSPVIVFIGIMVWGWLWGLIGALVAVPLLASFKIICEGVESLNPIAEFMGHPREKAKVDQ